MNVKIGCDIIEIKRIERLDKSTLQKIFHPTELKNKPESLAGIFAAKEACKKVFNDLKWHDIEIKKTKEGKPFAVLIDDEKIVSKDLSISHDGKYAMATAVFLIK